jgi:hypothetical protein
VPKKPRKLLVFSRITGFPHKSVPWGAQALRVIGEKSGAYTAVLSDDPAMFDKDKLNEFDAVAFNNNCGNPVQDTQRRKNLLEFVAGGRGLVGIHCAALSNRRPPATMPTVVLSEPGADVRPGPG